MMPPVKTKRDFVRRYEAGEFGNRAPTWHTLEEWKASGYTGLIHVRNRIPGGPTYYDVAPEQVERCWQLAGDPSSLYISAMCPTHLTTMQGYLSDVHGIACSAADYALTCSFVRQPMRAALLESSFHAVDSVALAVCRHFMCPRSYEWLRYLMREYPLHTFEFTCLATNWGTERGFNTLFWEVRDY